MHGKHKSLASLIGTRKAWGQVDCFCHSQDMFQLLFAPHNPSAVAVRCSPEEHFEWNCQSICHYLKCRNSAVERCTQGEATLVNGIGLRAQVLCDGNAECPQDLERGSSFHLNDKTTDRAVFKALTPEEIHHPGDSKDLQSVCKSANDGGEGETQELL